MINSFDDLIQEVGCCPNGLEKAIFKGTESGVAISFDADKKQFIICGIVEGSHGEQPQIILKLPFDKKDFWDAITNADEEACFEWREIHEQPIALKAGNRNFKGIGWKQ